MKVILKTDKNMELEHIIILMAPFISVNSIIILYTGKVSIRGLIIKNTKANGLRIRKMEKEHLHLPMGVSI